MKIERCYWYEIGQSSIKEGRVFQAQHPDIDFTYCRNCDGLNTRCIGYTSDSSERRGRINDIGEMCIR